MDTSESRLDVRRIERETAHLSIRPDLRYLPVTDSTNRVARDLPAGEWRTGTTVITDFQEAGRGRSGRSWTAPPGSGLLLSAILELPPGAAPAEGIMLTALAVSDAIRDVTGLSSDLKWPNDVLVRGRKVCGILAEYAQDEGRRKLILGVGLNVNLKIGDELGLESATSLSRELGSSVSREDLVVGLFKRLDLWYCSLTEDPDTVFSAWQDRLETIGCPVLVIQPGRSWEGTAVGVRRNGGLEVQTADGRTETVYVADVSVRRR